MRPLSTILYLVALLATAGSDSRSVCIFSRSLSPAAICESAWMKGGGRVAADLRRSGVMQLRGGRMKEDARNDEENERLALEYMEKIRSKGQRTSLDLNAADADDEVVTIGVPEQVRGDEEESKSRARMYPRSIQWATTKKTALIIQLGVCVERAHVLYTHKQYTYSCTHLCVSIPISALHIQGKSTGRRSTQCASNTTGMCVCVSVCLCVCVSVCVCVCVRESILI